MAFKFVNSTLRLWIVYQDTKTLLYSKRELNCDNINYKLKSCCHVLFWFAIDCALWININTNAPFFNTHRLEAEVFLKLLNLSRKKIKMLFTGLGRSVLGETMPSVWGPPSEYGLGRYSRPRAQFLPIRTSQRVNNIYICYVQLTAVKKASANQCHVTVSRAQVYNSLRWPVFKVIRWPVVGFTWSQAQVHNEKAI